MRSEIEKENLLRPLGWHIPTPLSQPSSIFLQTKFATQLFSLITHSSPIFLLLTV